MESTSRLRPIALVRFRSTRCLQTERKCVGSPTTVKMKDLHGPDTFSNGGFWDDTNSAFAIHFGLVDIDDSFRDFVQETGRGDSSAPAASSPASCAGAGHHLESRSHNHRSRAEPDVDVGSA